MPRLFRESPLNAIWEGSGNVIALDVLRTLGKEPQALEALRAELTAARGGYADYDRFLARLDDDLARPGEAQARRADRAPGAGPRGRTPLARGPERGGGGVLRDAADGRRRRLWRGRRGGRGRDSQAGRVGMT